MEIYLIHTPTMRTPEEIVDPRIIYQCMRTTLIVAKMMWKAFTQINNPPKKIDWAYVETVDMLPEEDFLQTDCNY